ncbi:NUDIX hydrolase domain-like protein [Chytriomyces sp. MP71]|nr:NUDIX hydrolase domain-like protein [Chytriomyces sp. MP71]
MAASPYEVAIAACNTLDAETVAQLVSGHSQAGLPLYADASSKHLIGLVRREVLDLIASTTGAESALVVAGDRVTLHPLLATEQQRTEVLEALLLRWRDDEGVSLIQASKWRNERYSVWDSEGKVAVRVERAAAGLFAIRAYGCHVNGFVRNKGNKDQLSMWVARRSYTKQTYPGMLDNMVGGGLPHGLSPTENTIKECFEEAGISFSPGSNHVLRPVSVITSFMESDQRGWVPDTEFIYDLELDQDFVPQCQDGEVHGFELMDMDQVKAALLKNEFMPESGLCVIDFLLRHGILDPSTEPGYANVAAGLHRPLPFPGPRYQV